MPDKKSDLTRIEDLNEFFHEESEEENSSPSTDDIFSDNTSEVFSDDQSDFSPPPFEETFENEEKTIVTKLDDLLEETPPPFESSSNEEKTVVANLDQMLEASSSFEDNTASFNDPFEETAPNSTQEEKITSSDTDTDLDDAFNYTPAPAPALSEIKSFAQNMGIIETQREGNPPFSLKISEILFEDEIEDIFETINNFKLNIDPEATLRSLKRGNLLIPRLGEFTAIELTHKLRRFNLVIDFGLSEEIFPSSEAEEGERGIPTKRSIFQNKTHSFNLSQKSLNLHDILSSTLPQLEGYIITKHLGVVSASEAVTYELAKENKPEHLNPLYEKILFALKNLALQRGAQAVLAVQYQFHKLSNDEESFQILGTGNLVCLQKVNFK